MSKSGLSSPRALAHGVIRMTGRDPDEPHRGATPLELDGVIGLAERAEHPVGHRSQASLVFLETLGQPCALVHQVTFFRRGVS